MTNGSGFKRSCRARPVIQGGRPRIPDTGHDRTTLVKAIEQSGAKAVIPPWSGVKDPRETDFALDAERYRSEGFFNRLKHYRARATRYAKRARNFASLTYLAASICG